MKGTSSKKMIQMVSLIPVVLMVCALFASVEASETGILAFEKDSVVLDLADSQWFELKINITDVTDLKAMVFSVEWDPTYLEVPSYTAGDFLPAGPPDATGWMITWDHVAGKMKEAANSFMPGKGPVSVSSPNWGWVMTLNFSYVGPDPPITTSINITKNIGLGMDTKWRDSLNVYHDFDYIDGDPYIHVVSTDIIPEFSSAVAMVVLLMVVTLLALVFKRKHGLRWSAIQ